MYLVWQLGTIRTQLPTSVHTGTCKRIITPSPPLERIGQMLNQTRQITRLAIENRTQTK